MTAALLVFGLLYVIGLGRAWTQAGTGRVITVPQVAFFTAGLGTLVVALVSPLHELAHTLFTAHMGQHLLLILFAAPLLVLGVPLVAWLQILPRRWRRGVWRWLRWGWAGKVIQVATAPLVVWALHLGLLLFWHLPSAYGAALENPTVHAVEHLTLLGSALLFWWVLLRPEPARQLNGGSGVLFLTTAAIVSGMIGAILTLAGTPLYPGQSAGAAGFGLTPLEDQQVAGLLMWLPGGLIYLIAASLLFVRWIGRSPLDRPVRVLPTRAARSSPAEVHGPKRISLTRR